MTTERTHNGKFGFEPRDDRDVDVDCVDVIDFVNADTGRPLHAEYIRVAADVENAELRLYRALGEADTGEYVSTRIPAIIRHRGRENPKPEGFNLHGNDATDLITWLTCLAKERSETSATVEYYHKNNSGQIDRSDFDAETLAFEYETDTGRQRRVVIDSLYQNNFQSIARL